VSLERQDILDTLIARLLTHSDAPMVTKDVRKRATLNYYPAIFVVPGADEIVGVRGARAPKFLREWTIGVVSFIQGTTGEEAPDELETFQEEVKNVIYFDETRKIGNYGAGIREQMMLQPEYPPKGNNTIAGGIVFLVQYAEDTGRMYEPVAPTT